MRVTEEDVINFIKKSIKKRVRKKKVIDKYQSIKEKIAQLEKIEKSLKKHSKKKRSRTLRNNSRSYEPDIKLEPVDVSVGDDVSLDRKYVSELEDSLIYLKKENDLLKKKVKVQVQVPGSVLENNFLKDDRRGSERRDERDDERKDERNENDERRDERKRERNERNERYDERKRDKIEDSERKKDERRDERGSERRERNDDGNDERKERERNDDGNDERKERERNDERKERERNDERRGRGERDERYERGERDERYERYEGDDESDENSEENINGPSISFDEEEKNAERDYTDDEYTDEDYNNYKKGHNDYRKKDSGEKGSKGSKGSKKDNNFFEDISNSFKNMFPQNSNKKPVLFDL